MSVDGDLLDVIPCRIPSGATSVAIDNIDEGVTIDDVEHLFGRFGLLYKVAIFNSSPRYAIAIFYSEKAAAKAADRANGATIGSRPCQTRVMAPSSSEWEAAVKILPLDKAQNHCLCPHLEIVTDVCARFARPSCSLITTWGLTVGQIR